MLSLGDRDRVKGNRGLDSIDTAKCRPMTALPSAGVENQAAAGEAGGATFSSWARSSLAGQHVARVCRRACGAAPGPGAMRVRPG
jgi:hypothetical protein